MKHIILMASILFALPSFSQELSLTAKQVITDAIGEYVYYEDEGFERLPQGQEDFKFEFQMENKIIVTGTSLSEWDMKEIEYYCEIKVKNDTLIETAEDVEVDFCKLEGEHWPHM